MTGSYQITLSTPEVPTLTIGDGGDFGLRALDLGFPQVRAVVSPRPAADGVIDETTYIGSRLITADIILYPGTWEREQALRAFLSPRYRSSMAITPPDGPELVTTVRGAALSAPVVLEDLTGGVKRINAQWTAPFGILESAAMNTVVVAAAGTVLAAGRTYDLQFDRDYPAADPSGSSTVTNAGTAEAYPVLKVHGPCTAPAIAHTTSGRVLSFPTLTINEGDFLEIDTRNKTIRYNANADDSRYGALDFAISSWWSLSPGLQRIRFIPETFTAPSQVQVTWRDAWI